MSKIFLSQVPATDEFLSSLHSHFPECDAYSFYTYLTIRKVTSDLENALESYFSLYGVSSGRFMLLMILSANENGMMPSELAQQCGVTQATVSGLLNGLEKAQLIVRETHTHDGRAYVIKLSSKGHELLGKVKPEFLACLDKMMGSFDLGEKKNMVTMLDRFDSSIKCLQELKATTLQDMN
jgi:DNA-binding MarR family transcriptional regulator